MAITTNSDRQYPLGAFVDFAFGDLTSATLSVAFELPADAVVIGGHVEITTAFNSGTSDALTIGDGTAADRFIDITAGSGALSAGLTTAFTADGFKYTAPDNIDLLWTAVGTAATTGAGRVYIQYVIIDRAQENQG